HEDYCVIEQERLQIDSAAHQGVGLVAQEKPGAEPGERGIGDQYTEPQMNLRQFQANSAAHDDTRCQREHNQVEDGVLDAQSGRKAKRPAEYIDGGEDENQQGEEVAHYEPTRCASAAKRAAIVPWWVACGCLRGPGRFWASYDTTDSSRSDTVRGR